MGSGNRIFHSDCSIGLSCGMQHNGRVLWGTASRPEVFTLELFCEGIISEDGFLFCCHDGSKLSKGMGIVQVYLTRVQSHITASY